MKRTYINTLAEKIGQTVRIGAWVDVARDQGKMAFFDFRDATGTVQGVVFGKPEVLAAAKRLRPEWVVAIEGVVNERPENMRNPDVHNGDIELEITGITVLSEAAELPFDPNTDLNLDTLLDYRPLTLRRKRERAIFRVQHEIVRAYRAFLTREGFVEFQSPKLVGDDAEGGGNVFEVKYLYDKTAYLATSPQLYKQIMVGAYERVFTTGNVFRAEKHATTRHINEYTSIDMEMGFIDDHIDVMRTETALMRYIIAHLAETCAAEFALLGAQLPRVPAGADCFPAMKLREAQALIRERTGTDKTAEPDLEPEDERWLSTYAHEELDSDFIFITHYPVSKRPFYTYEDPDDPGYTKSFDLLFRGVEITTGGQRRHTYDDLVAGAEQKGLDPEHYSFYLQAFKYGLPPHGGWGMGLERLTQKFLGLKNVKEATAFPRDINRIDVRLSHHENQDNA